MNDGSISQIQGENVSRHYLALDFSLGKNFSSLT